MIEHSDDINIECMQTFTVSPGAARARAAHTSPERAANAEGIRSAPAQRMAIFAAGGSP